MNQICSQRKTMVGKQLQKMNEGDESTGSENLFEVGYHIKSLWSWCRIKWTVKAMIWNKAQNYLEKFTEAHGIWIHLNKIPIHWKGSKLKFDGLDGSKINPECGEIKGESNQIHNGPFGSAQQGHPTHMHPTVLSHQTVDSWAKAHQNEAQNWTEPKV